MGSLKRNWLRLRTPCIGALCIALATATAMGVGTSHWTHTAEKHFKAGRFEHVVATNLGELKLSRQIKTLLEQDTRISAVHCLVEAPDGTLYAGTGPQGVVLQVRDGKVSDAVVLEDGTSIFALALDAQGRLLIGASGDRGRVLRLDQPGQPPRELLAPDGVQYVWSLYTAPDGAVYAGTGPNGQLFAIGPDEGGRVLLDTNEHNLLSLIGDGKDFVYAGTDPNGLVYRVNRKSGEAFVLHDAAETEVSALALAGDGTLYAGTAEALETAGEADDEDGEKAGRPEGAAGGAAIPAHPPEDPEPPALPDPNPSEPDPIPKARPLRAFQDADEPPDNGEDPGDDDSADAPDDDENDKPAHAGAGEHGTALAATRRGEPRAGGNAVYSIDRNGFVTEVFRANVLVLALAEENGTLLAGTGSDGHVYQISPREEETVALAKVDPKQVMCLLPLRDGRVAMGLANAGGIAVMSDGFAPRGTFISSVLDAAQASRFGNLRLGGALPPGTSLTVSTRSGNLSEPGDDKDGGGWSAWSEEAPATEFVPIRAPAARFLQYRLTLATEEPARTPIVDEVDVAYQVPNLAPKVSAVAIGTGNAEETADPADAAESALENVEDFSDALHAPQKPLAQGTGKQTITWEASDANHDDLRYAVFFRAGTRGPWLLLKDDLTESSHEWDTRGIADGRYFIRIVASDERANPAGTGKSGSRVSDVLLVDNTAPRIGDMKVAIEDKQVTVSFSAADRTSTLASFEYSVDSADHWQSVLPADTIPDSPAETVTFSVPSLAPGPHQIAVRATDSAGNVATVASYVTIEPADSTRPAEDDKQ